MSQAAMQEVKFGVYWITVLDYGAIGATAFSLTMLVIQLVFAGEAYRPRHTILLVAAVVGFVAHVCTSRRLIALERTRKPGD
jgi:hypothetical protein